MTLLTGGKHFGLLVHGLLCFKTIGTSFYCKVELILSVQLILLCRHICSTLSERSFFILFVVSGCCLLFCIGNIRIFILYNEAGSLSCLSICSSCGIKTLMLGFTQAFQPIFFFRICHVHADLAHAFICRSLMFNNVFCYLNFFTQD